MVATVWVGGPYVGDLLLSTDELTVMRNNRERTARLKVMDIS
ncbi:MAG: hypothetical protein ACE5DS_01020 [Kiloniellaceae bacterium]